MKVTAAIARQADQPFSIEEVELDNPRDDEILVEIHGVGLCHTDLVFKGAGQDVYPLPAVLGHEGSGIVQKVGANITKVKAGDRVAISFRSCGDCDRCDAGDAPYCRTMPMLNYTGIRTDGSKSLQDEQGPISGNFFGQSSFATHALTYERNVVKVPDDVPLELLGPLGCGIQTGFGAVKCSLEAEKGSSIMILGGGAVGLSAVMGAKVQECATIIVMEPHPARRELAIELGATHVLDPKEVENLAETVREILPFGVDYIFDTTGIPPLLQSAIECLGSKGVFGFVGIAPPGTPMPGDLGAVIMNGHTLKGIIEGDADPDVLIPEMIQLYKDGKMPFDKMVQTYPMSDINQAVEDQHSGKCVKVVLLPR